MKVLPRNWHFRSGRARLYRRLSVGAKVLALIAGAAGIVYWHRPELRPIPAPQQMESFANCDAVRAAGRASLRQGEPGYSPHLDKDGDGIACEPWRRRF